MDRANSHRDITFQDLKRFTVNKNGQICLDGKPIEVQRMTLTKWQAAVGTGTAIVVTVGVLFQIFVNFPWFKELLGIS